MSYRDDYVVSTTLFGGIYAPLPSLTAQGTKLQKFNFTDLTHAGLSKLDYCGYVGVCESVREFIRVCGMRCSHLQQCWCVGDCGAPSASVFIYQHHTTPQHMAQKHTHTQHLHPLQHVVTTISVGFS